VREERLLALNPARATAMSACLERFCTFSFSTVQPYRLRFKDAALHFSLLVRFDAMIKDMKRDSVEILIGCCAIILFGVVLIVWPQLADTLGRLSLVYFRELVHRMFGSLSSQLPTR
jgi:hypothetical protein